MMKLTIQPYESFTHKTLSEARLVAVIFNIHRDLGLYFVGFLIKLELE
jgi:hypothetical protein